MGSLYECLREARLEKFYPTLRANGFSSAESLIELSSEDVATLGLVTVDEHRRLFDLVDIIRSVYEVDVEDLPDISEATAYSVSVPINRQSQSRKPARKRNRSPQYASSSSSVLPRQTQADSQKGRPNVRRHVSAPSVPRVRSAFERLEAAAYPGNSDSSNDDTHSDSSGPSDYEPATKHVNRASATPPRTRKVATVERVKHTQGYNYGVPRNKVKQKSSAFREDTSDNKIRVCVRKRPRNKREIRATDDDIVVVERSDTITINEPKLAVDLTPYTLEHEFCFDEVFHEGCGNEEVFERAAKPLIDCVFQGGSATCFAYGQTGAGKTHTMLGSREQPGLYLLAAQEIFSISQSGQYGRGLRVWVSFFEIYCGQLFDLLNKRNRLHAREDGSHRVCIAGLTETQVTDVPSIMQVLEYGNQVRSKGSTGVNPDSSRSHAVLQVEVRTSADRRLGRMSFIDLAGSERAADVTDTDRQTRLEGAEINQSLLALKECIRSIDQDSRHTPFRQSKLTHILKDSFIGNSRTCMIANVSPTYTACENSLNTLRYADRVKELRKTASQNLRASRVIAQSVINAPFVTPPSIFHPSNISCASTPVRPRPSRKHAGRKSPPAASNLPDPLETPIRGNFPGHRKTSRESGTRVSSAPVRRSKSAVSRQSLPTTTAIQRERIEIPTRSSSDSNPALSDTCNLNIYDHDILKARTGHHQPLAASNDRGLDVAPGDFEELDQELNDLNKTGGKSGTPIAGFDAAFSEEFRDFALVPSSDIRSHRVQNAQRTSMNVPEVSEAAAYGRSVEVASSVCGSHYATISVRDSSSVKPKPLVLRQKPTDFGEEEAGVSSEDRESSRSDTDDLLFGSPKETQQGKPAVSEDVDLEEYVPPPKEPLSSVRGRHDRSQEPVTPRRAEFLPQASPAKSSDLTSFSRSENVKLRALPFRGSLQGPDPDPVRLQAEDFTLQDDIQAGLFGEEFFPQQHIDDFPQEKNGASAYPPQRNDLSRREKTDPLLARHRARQNMPDPSEFLRHLTKQALSKPTVAPSPVIANIPLPVLPSEDRTSSVLSAHGRTVSPSNALEAAQPTSSQRQPDSLSDHETDLKRIPSFGSLRSVGTPSPSTTESPGRKMSDGGSGPGSMSPVDSRKPSSDARQRRRSRSNSRDREHRNKSSSPALHVDTAATPLVNSESRSAIKTAAHSVENLMLIQKMDSCPVLTEEVDVGEPMAGLFLPASVDYMQQPLVLDTAKISSPTLQSFSGTPDDIEIHNMHPDPALYEHRDGTNDLNRETTKRLTQTSADEAKSSNGAIVTEKLATFSPVTGFAPIHPQPVTDDRVRISVSKDINKQMMVSRSNPLTVSTSTSGSIMRATSNLQRLATVGVPEDASAAKEVFLANCQAETTWVDSYLHVEYKMAVFQAHIITAHEEQLAAITSLCKQEMKLLLAFRAGHKDTGEYVRRMGDILTLKLKTVNLLQDQIGALADSRGRFKNPAFAGEQV